MVDTGVVALYELPHVPPIYKEKPHMNLPPLWYAVKFDNERHPRAIFSKQSDAEEWARQWGGRVVPVRGTILLEPLKDYVPR